MKRIMMFAMFVIALTIVSCEDDSYTIDEAYERAEITNVTMYDRALKVVSDKTQIDADACTVTVPLKKGADISDLKMVATIYAGATLTPGMAVGYQDYSEPRTFTVTSPGKTVSKQWTVTVISTDN